MITLFDIIIFTIITASSMFGMYSGILKIIISLSGFVISMVATYYLYPYTKEIIIVYSNNEVMIVLSSWIISYIISLVICTFLTHKLIKIVSVISGGIIDRFLGLLAGLLRGGMICLILFLSTAIFTSNSYLKAETLEDIANNTNVNQYPEWLKKSLTSPCLDNITKYIIEMLPKDTLQSIKLPQKLGAID